MTGGTGLVRLELRCSNHSTGLGRGFFGAIDQRDVRSEHSLQERLEEWIVRASQHERVHTGVNEWREILTSNELARRVVGPSFFDERREQRTGASRDSHVWIERANRTLVCTRRDRSRCADDANVPGGT